MVKMKSTDHLDIPDIEGLYQVNAAMYPEQYYIFVLFYVNGHGIQPINS